MEYTLTDDTRATLTISETERAVLVHASEAGAGVYVDSDFLAVDEFTFGGTTRRSNEFTPGDIETLRQMVETARERGVFEELAEEDLSVEADIVDGAATLESDLSKLVTSLNN